MRNQKTIVGEFYHLFNCSVSSEIIFRDEEDYARFLFLITHVQSPVLFNHLKRPIPYFLKSGNFKTSEYAQKTMAKNRYVELVAFEIGSDHFHLVVKAVKESGVPLFMQRVQNAYSKYFNTKYERRGHVFRGPYEYIIIADNEQLTHLSAHLHALPRENKSFKGKEFEYQWSSFQDYSKNRWGAMLRHEYISEKFKDEKEYKKFVLHPSLKKRKQVLGGAHMFT